MQIVYWRYKRSRGAKASNCYTQFRFVVYEYLGWFANVDFFSKNCEVHFQNCETEVNKDASNWNSSSSDWLRGQFVWTIQHIMSFQNWFLWISDSSVTAIEPVPNQFNYMLMT